MRKFSENLEIQMDEQQLIKNKEQIINDIKLVSNIDELEAIKEYYYRLIETISFEQNLKDFKEILEVIKKQEQVIKDGEISLEESFQEIKEDNDKLKNINIIQTKKEDNDKLNGISKDITYMQITINGQNELYEITNIKGFEYYLQINREQLKNMSELEIIETLKQFAKKTEMNSMEPRHYNELSSDSMNKELNNISSLHLKNVVENDESSFLKEKVDIKKNMDIYAHGAEIKYGINSNGERIYTAADNIYKFEGEQRNMKELTNDTNQDSALNSSTFDSFKSGSGKLIEINIDNYQTINDFVIAEDNLKYIIEAISMDIAVTDNQIAFLTKFMNMCISREEMIFKTNEYNQTIQNPYELSFVPEDIPGELKTIYETYYTYCHENNKYINEEISEIIKRKDNLEKQKHTKENKNNKVKQLTRMEKAGFISVAIILEASVIIGGIFAILALVKK